MLIEKTNMMVTNVNPRKEGKGEGMTLASDIKVQFETPRVFMDKVVPDQERRWSDQFFTDKGDLRLTHLYPVHLYQKLKEMRVEVYMGKQPTVFVGATVTGIEMEPLSGGYVRVGATLQVHPTPAESGKLDSIAKEVVEIAIDTMTGDLHAGTETTDSE